MSAIMLAMAAGGTLNATASAQGTGAATDIAMFNDATETLFAVAEQRRANDPTAPWVPRRSFVKDADEAHRFAFAGLPPVVGMSLDDLIDCARSGERNAGELVTLAGVHRGFLQLMAAPGITDIADLKGRRIAVDTDTGYASALFEMLHLKGMERGRDYDVVYAGATNLRYERLLRREFDATLLGAPFTRLAARQGYPSLGTVIGALGGYQAVVLVAHRAWLAANADTARRIATCLTETLAWTGAPENRSSLEGFMSRIFPVLDAASIRDVTEDMFGPGSEFLRTGKMAPGDMRVVIDLFNASRRTAVTQADVVALTDLSYLPAR
jgi:ABC-type amino acid transport substrate-binding protein